MGKKKICNVCGIEKNEDEFYMRKNGKTHNKCKACWKQANRKKQQNKTCAYCGKVFKPVRCTQKTCSPFCSKKHSIKANYNPPQKYCRECGKEIIGGRSDKCFCNEKCSYEWHKLQPNYKKRRKLYGEKYRKENADELKGKKRIYQKEKWEERKEYHRKWRNENRIHLRKWREENKEHINNRDRQKKLDYMRKAYNENPEHLRKLANECYHRNNEKYKKIAVAKAQKDRDELHDCYVKSLLTQNSNLSAIDIPKSMVEAQRALIKIKRLINELSN